jgi:hypothetical protein
MHLRYDILLGEVKGEVVACADLEKVKDAHVGCCNLGTQT